MKKLFLISSSRYQNGEFWAHCLNPLGEFLGTPEKGRNRILFIPYANADDDYDGYTKMVSAPFKKFGYEVVGNHTYKKITDCLSDKTICAVCVGGGNTWLLNYTLSVYDMLLGIKHKVETGKWKYISASAGTVMAGESMLTTNDMAPILPRSSDGFGLVPFLINPHFVSGSLLPKHMGETREERIRQVILINPGWIVVGLPEGCWIEKTTKDYVLRGIGQASIFRKGGNNTLWLPNEPFDKDGML